MDITKEIRSKTEMSIRIQTVFRTDATTGPKVIRQLFGVTDNNKTTTTGSLITITGTLETSTWRRPREITYFLTFENKS